MGLADPAELIKVFVETKLDTRLLLTVPQTCTVNALQGTPLMQLSAALIYLF